MNSRAKNGDAYVSNGFDAIDDDSDPQGDKEKGDGMLHPSESQEGFRGREARPGQTLAWCH